MKMHIFRNVFFSITVKAIDKSISFLSQSTVYKTVLPLHDTNFVVNLFTSLNFTFWDYFHSKVNLWLFFRRLTNVCEITLGKYVTDYILRLELIRVQQLVILAKFRTFQGGPFPVSTLFEGGKWTFRWQFGSNLWFQMVWCGWTQTSTKGWYLKIQRK